MRHDSIILNLPWLSLLLVATALLSWQGTRLVIRHAAAIGVLHAPNERSFHSDPVPHGGGLSPVLVYLVAVLLSFVLGLLNDQPAYCILGAGTVVAMLGLWDDIRPLPARTRLAVQTVAALVAITLCGEGLTSILPVPMWLSYSIATLALVCGSTCLTLWMESTVSPPLSAFSLHFQRRYYLRTSPSVTPVKPACYCCYWLPPQQVSCV